MGSSAVSYQSLAPSKGSDDELLTYSTKQALHGDSVDFDPEKHLAFKTPSEIITMPDIGYPEDTGVSPVAVSQPFQLFSDEAVEVMRESIFKPEVMENCKFSSNIAPCQLRGYATKYAPFIYDAWHNPKTLEIISVIAGIDLIPNMDLEIGHVNISVKSEQQTRDERAEIDKQKRYFADDEGIAGCPWEDDKPVVGWHTDSYPFVCVLMLSDCESMIGGETALRTANGDILKVRGPQRGRYITHQALRALGARERITMVTSFRPKSPFLADDSVLTSVRPISRLPDLYYEYSEYRLQILEERVRTKLHEIRSRHHAGKKIDTPALKRFLAEQELFVGSTNFELVEEGAVKVGILDELEFPDAGVGPFEEAERDPKRIRVV
ncbi:MAG: hypothetical protein M1828_006734 [Chrysothrix sp. TS-e1954]|nr:MAG: hypothetical protein M1828_006734 [Chrysothrix sp. TS-e1954]